jgi:hypothetical protein
MNTRRKLGLQAQTLATLLNRGGQVDARGATQTPSTVENRGAQAVARVSCLSQVLYRDAEAVTRGAVP